MRNNNNKSIYTLQYGLRFADLGMFLNNYFKIGTLVQILCRLWLNYLVITLCNQRNRKNSYLT